MQNAHEYDATDARECNGTVRSGLVYACRCTRLCRFCCRKVALTPGMAMLSP